MRKNQICTLTPNQTKELQSILISHKGCLDPADFSYVWLKLNRHQAVMTQRQLHRLAMTMVETGYLAPLPEWYHELLEPSLIDPKENQNGQ